MTEEVKKATPENKTENSTTKNVARSVGSKPQPSNNKRRDRRERRPKEVKEFEESILKIDRVTRVVKGGRRLRFRVSVIIGDQKGRVGFGVGKSAEVMIGIQKAVTKAKKELIKIPIINGTIPHEQKGKFKASQVLLFPATEGKGIIAGGAVRKILELAGVKDVLSKVHGSRNKLNVAHATLNALMALTNEEPRQKKGKKDEKKTEDDTKENKTTKVEKTTKKTETSK